jgi:glycosyltransferase 2 family protein
VTTAGRGSGEPGSFEAPPGSAPGPPLLDEEAGATGATIARRLRDRRTLVSLVVPVVVLLLVLAALPGFRLDQLPALILAADAWWLVVAFAVYYAGFPLRGVRWAILVRAIGHRLGVRDSTEIIFISWLVNCVVPAKLGDVYRAWLLRLNARVSLSATFGTVFSERVFDLFAIVTLGLAAAFWSFRDGLSEPVRIIVGLGVAVVILLVVGLLAVRNLGRRILVRLPVPHAVVELYDRFEEGVFAIDRRQVPLIGLMTFLIWTTEALRLLFVVEAMPFQVSLGISGAFFVALIASLLTAIPFTPAGLGIVEAGIVGILTVIYAVPPTEAAAIAIIDRAISVLSVIVLGSITYVLSSKTRGDPTIAGPSAERPTAVP